MSYKGKIAGGLLATGLVGGIGYASYELYEKNQFPEFVLSPLAEAPPLPEPEKSPQPTIVCPDEIDAALCTPQNALAAFNVHREKKNIDIDELNAKAPHVSRLFEAVEDKRFKDDKSDGCDVKAIVRAAKVKATTGKTEGGSTIPRQFAAKAYKLEETPNLVLRADPQVSAIFDVFGRDVALQAYECKIARTLVRDYDKDEIEEGYLNLIPSGRNAIGIHEAADVMFGVKPEELTELQAMAIVAMLRSPSLMDSPYSAETDATAKDYLARLRQEEATIAQSSGREPRPITQGRLLDAIQDDIDATNDADRKKELMDVHQHAIESQRLARATRTVIGVAEQAGIITPERAEELRRTPIKLKPFEPLQSGGRNYFQNADAIGARHAVDYAIKETANKLQITTEQVATSGLTIMTTIHSRNQKAMTDTLRSQPFLQDGAINAAGISMLETGDITAMSGSLNYDTYQLNLAATLESGGTGRSGGSSMKGFAAAAALNYGLSPDQELVIDRTYTVSDTSGTGKDWTINGGDECNLKNATPPCTMTPADIVSYSSNTGTGQLVDYVGIETIAEGMRGLGVNVEPPYYPSMVLGTETDPINLARGYNSLILNQGRAVGSFIVRSVKQGDNTVFTYEAAEPVQIYPSVIAADAIKGLIGTLHYGTARGAVEFPHGDNSRAGKTGTAGKPEGQKGITDVWFTGSACSSNHSSPSTQPNDGQTASFWAGNPEGKTVIPSGISSKSMARVWGQYMDASTLSTKNGTCDVTK